MSKSISLLLLAALSSGCSDSTSPAIDLAFDLRADARTADARPDQPIADVPSLPDGACGDAGCPSATSPLWFLHVSDLHFGGGPVDARFALVLSELLPTIKPAATFNTGDSVEEGGDSPWKPYVDLVTGKTPAYPGYLEIPGNHDLKNNGIGNYLANTVTGKAGGGIYGDALVNTPGGQVRVIRTNTADGGTNAINVLGSFGDKQRDALLALAPPPTPPLYTVVLGHHPIVGAFGLQVLGTDGSMKKVIDATGGRLYLCGHVHTTHLSFYKKTLVVQASSLGKSDPPSLLLVALDAGSPSVREIVVSGGSVPALSWPIVLITAPADTKLGGTNPHASPLSAAVAFKVRALAFAPSPISTVEARLDMGSWQPLASAGGAVHEGMVQPSKGGKLGLEVRATSKEGTTSHAVTVEIGP
jgi:hypothetical protein